MHHLSLIGISAVVFAFSFIAYWWVKRAPLVDRTQVRSFASLVEFVRIALVINLVVAVGFETLSVYTDSLKALTEIERIISRR
jgi:flagellar biosynthesis protein FlhB